MAMNVQGLKTLHAYANLFGIIATSAKTNHSRQKASAPIDRVKAIVFVGVFVFAVAYNIYGKIFDVGQQLEITTLLVNTLADVLMFLFNVASVCKLNVTSGNRLLEFLQKLQSLETFLTNKRDVAAKNKRALMQLYAFHALGVTFGCFSAYVCTTNFGFRVYKYFLLREFQNSHLMIAMHMIICYAKLMALRMSELNLHLKQCVALKQNMWIDLNVVPRKGKKVFSVKTISDAYVTVVELVDEYNELFGILIFLYCGNMIFNIMVPVNMVLLSLREIPVFTDSKFGLEFITFCALWAIFPIFIGGKLFCACSGVENEANVVPKLCYALSKRLGNDESRLRNDLNSYASQADRLKLKFTAGGFFNVNVELVMPIVGSVFTYLIVLMQFHNL